MTIGKEQRKLLCLFIPEKNVFKKKKGTPKPITNIAIRWLKINEYFFMTQQ